MNTANVGLRFLPRRHFQDTDGWQCIYPGRLVSFTFQAGGGHKLIPLAHPPFENTFGSEDLPFYLGKDILAKGYKKWAEKYGIVSSITTYL
jgi:hypothetical protein